MNTVLICGGCLDRTYALEVIRTTAPDCVIGIDRGLNFCYENQVKPDYILGDFDSIDKEALQYYESQPDTKIRRYQPEKDATDTAIGMELALKLGSDRIFLLGATGGRLDHYMGNLKSLITAAKHGCQAWILDKQNAITLLDKPTELCKKEQFGNYVSFFSMGDCVKGLTLRGFKYPLTEYTMENEDGIGISNEIVDETATVSFREGLVLMILSRDKA